MLYLIKDLDDPLAQYLNDDPVRPHIPHNERFGNNRQVIALTDGTEVRAIVCARLCSSVPTSETELLADNCNEPTTAVFYTIWSYKSGSGQQLIREGVQLLKEQKPSIKRFVTLSPTTEMARKFHIKNGAIVLQINPDTVNYEYIVV
jgi:hypothetical protein